MSDYSRELAKIEQTFLGYQDHGHLTAVLRVSCGAVSQSVGGYSLDEYDAAAGLRVGTVRAAEFIGRTVKACGADSWEQLRGRTIYVLIDGTDGVAVGIENLPTEPGERFIFADVFGKPGAP